MNIYRQIRERGDTIAVPASCVSEWWRGKTEGRELLLRALRPHIEPLTERASCLAGEALAKVADAPIDSTMTIDAQVMATAALRGGVVYTGDVEDLEMFRTFFPSVRVLSV